MKTRKEIAELAALLAGRTPGNPAAIATHTMILLRIATAADRHAVNLCNIPDYQETFTAKKAALLKRVEPIAALYRLRVEIGGDPRGMVTKLHAIKGSPPIRGNTWGGDEDGYGI